MPEADGDFIVAKHWLCPPGPSFILQCPDLGSTQLPFQQDRAEGTWKSLDGKPVLGHWEGVDTETVGRVRARGRLGGPVGGVCLLPSQRGSAAARVPGPSPPPQEPNPHFGRGHGRR